MFFVNQSTVTLVAVFIALHSGGAPRAAAAQSTAAQIATPQDARGADPDPVHWLVSIRPGAVNKGDTVSVTLTATIDAGFHVYSLTQLDEGPYPLMIRTIDDALVKAAGDVKGPKPEKIPTSSFGIPVEWYTSKAVFRVPVRVAETTAASAVARIAVRYQSCSKSICLLPKTIELTQSIPLRARNSNGSPARQ